MKNDFDFAEVLNRYRVIPRVMLFGCAYLVIHSIDKFWALDVPTTEHTAVTGLVIGIIPAVLAFYQNSGKK